MISLSSGEDKSLSQGRHLSINGENRAQLCLAGQDYFSISVLRTSNTLTS